MTELEILQAIDAKLGVLLVVMERVELYGYAVALTVGMWWGGWTIARVRAAMSRGKDFI